VTWSIEFVLYAATEGGERVGWGGGGRGREEEINKRQDSGGGGVGAIKRGGEPSDYRALAECNEFEVSPCPWQPFLPWWTFPTVGFELLEDRQERWDR